MMVPSLCAHVLLWTHLCTHGLRPPARFDVKRRRTASRYPKLFLNSAPLASRIEPQIVPAGTV